MLLNNQMINEETITTACSDACSEKIDKATVSRISIFPEKKEGIIEVNKYTKVMCENKYSKDKGGQKALKINANCSVKMTYLINENSNILILKENVLEANN
jgi:hypothetical protein